MTCSTTHSACLAAATVGVDGGSRVCGDVLHSGYPLPLTERAKRWVNCSVLNDTAFLSDINVGAATMPACVCGV